MKCLSVHLQKYIFVGVINTIIGYLIFAILWFLFSSTFDYFIIIILSSILAIFASFMNMNKFVFNSNDNFFIKLIKFYASYIFIVLFNLICFPLLENIFKNAYVSQALFTLIAVLVSYILNKNYVFKVNRK